jgi:hypothetical protein
MWRRVLIGMSVAIITTVLLAVAGFWSPNSNWYWRRPTQAALLSGARHTPRRVSATLTQWALRAHTAGTTYEEAEEAATLFEGAGEATAASSLLLGLVRIDVASQQYDRAIRQATRSQKASSNSGALVALVVLHGDSEEERMGWVAALQAAHPEQEVSQVFWCLSQLQTLGNNLPQPCETVDWLRQRAQFGRAEYLRISQEIEALPRQAALKIKENEARIAELTKEENKHQSEYQSITAEIARLENEGWLDATGQAIIKALPLPKADDTLESYIAREGLCALPILRWLCRLDVIEPYLDLRQRQQQLKELRDLTAKVLSLTRGIIEDHRSDIKYWQSKEPLEKLTNERQELLPTFRAEVEQNISNRRPHVGLALEEAIAIASQ